MLSTSFWQKTMKLYFDQNSWLVGPRGIVEQIKMSIFFSSSCKRYIQLCLGPLNKLSTCLCAKQQKLYFDQNSWPIEPRNIFKQILIGGFIFSWTKILPIISWTSKFAMSIFSGIDTIMVF